MRRMQIVMGAALLGAMAGCQWPETRMVPVAEYGAAERTTVSAAPAFNAGPDTVRTTSPDGSTTFVCEDGSRLAASKVPEGSTPAC